MRLEKYLKEQTLPDPITTLMGILLVLQAMTGAGILTQLFAPDIIDFYDRAKAKILNYFRDRKASTILEKLKKDPALQDLIKRNAEKYIQGKEIPEPHRFNHAIERAIERRLDDEEKEYFNLILLKIRKENKDIFKRGEE